MSAKTFLQEDQVRGPGRVYDKLVIYRADANEAPEVGCRDWALAVRRGAQPLAASCFEVHRESFYVYSFWALLKNGVPDAEGVVHLLESLKELARVRGIRRLDMQIVAERQDLAFWLQKYDHAKITMHFLEVPVN